MSITRAQLEKFIRIRNRSESASNLQFGFDAGEAGFDVRELGDPHRLWDEHGQACGYRWDTEHGQLREQRFKLALFDEDGKQVYPELIDVGMRED